MKFSLIERILKRLNGTNPSQGVFKVLTWILVIFGVFLVVGILFPSAVSVVLNIVWVVAFTIVVIFFFLGGLVIFGLRKEAGEILDILLEGSLTLVDFVNFVKKAWKHFTKVLKEFLLYAAPAVSYIANLIIYVLLLMLYKFVGQTLDVTVMTVVLTVLLIWGVSVLNKPGIQLVDKDSWWAMFKNKFKNSFADGSELALFIFFLTMDSTKIFFLPAHLNIELHSRIGSYNLMERGFHYDEFFRTTITLVIITVISELIRNIVRIVSSARMYYKRAVSQSRDAGSKNIWAQNFKGSVRKSFDESKDDFIKFITFNTVLLTVFIFFPRLKLLTLGVASITSFALDFVIPGRLTPSPKNDLVSRILAKVFKL